MTSPFGKHILAEYFECDCTYLDSEQAIREVMLEAASASGATIVGNIFHHFSPQGVTGVVVIAESHLAIHTWPEFRYASVDLFTCGSHLDPWVGFEYLKERLQSRKWMSKEIIRGTLDEELSASG
ncbi:MAG: adenosylmethionine decarboxylase [Deltaproteobacteria bacterium]|nr:adenosylmethionine decarboxylase [Deltaproteobacteria bacterium]MBW2078113.1 adenosylmethionine decarboxylase [Deltaproteobacteria bacterium]RLB30976.1 MAG: adenosylmethionine decarboxylase [Deltaproteobacteria bacterium]